MDNNDVELTVTRSRFDSDEIYPLEVLRKSKDDVLFQPVTLRQNRSFFLCMAVSLILLFVYVFGIPQEQQEQVTLESSGMLDQGSMGNNNVKSHMDNRAKVIEAMNSKPGITHGQRKPHSSSWSAHNKDGQESPIPTTAQPAEETADAATTEPPMTEEAPPASENPDDTPATITNENSDQVVGMDDNATITQTPAEEGEESKSETKVRDLDAWHAIKVTKDDGIMYQVIDVLKHDPMSFTEGLTYFDGRLFESVGLNHQSALLELDPDTGATLRTIPMDKTIFGEGLTYCNGKLIQLSYKARKGFVYDAADLDKPPEVFTYDTTTHEGWGFTYNEKRNELIVSDGSEFLHIWNPETYEQIRRHRVMRLDGSPALRINELEWWRDRVVANVWFEDVLLIINPETGLVEKEYEFSHIWDQAGIVRNQKAEVFNGISVSSDPDVLYVTGKWWSNIFKIKLLPEVPEK